MDKLIDISSRPVANVLDLLLIDKSTKKNIIWATDTYEEFGVEFTDKIQMNANSLLGRTNLICPRIQKSQEAQAQRTRKKAEVFTPAWLCNLMNNDYDEDWFGRKDVFNTMSEDHTWTAVEGRIEFPAKKKWQHYVDSRRLEITCGEAPYLVSRYDVSTGEPIVPPMRRIGMLDRKLRIVNENTDTYEEWLKWAIRAFEASYGYEYQGDNILIARINLLLTFTDYYEERWERQPDDNLMQQMANKIAWNIWQMDGLKDTVPVGKPYEEFKQMTIFNMFGMEDENEPDAVPCKIFNWRSKYSLKFMDLKEMHAMGKKLFHYVIGNPPYQEDTDGAGRQAKPVYNLFMDEAKKIACDSISLITPSRWFSGGMGLDSFRSEMLSGRHLKAIVDYTNAKDIFPNTSISGGVNYFVWKRDYEGDCTFTNTTNGETSTKIRDLSEFPVLVRYNRAIDIIHKARKVTQVSLAAITSGLMPFGLSTNYRGRTEKSEKDVLTLYASNCITYISEGEISKGMEYVDKFKVMISKTGAEHAGEPSKEGTFRVIPSSMKVIGPNEICTHSYFLVGNYDNKRTADHLYKYMRTRLVRFLMLMSMSGYGLSKLVMNFVPLQDFSDNSDIDWSGDVRNIEVQLYKKYGFNGEEIDFIESNIKEVPIWILHI